MSPAPSPSLVLVEVKTSWAHRARPVTCTPKLLAGGASMIYVRSRRSLVTLGASGLSLALAFALLAVGATRLPGGWVAAIALAAGSLGGGLVPAWAVLQLRSCPLAHLALFRHRL